MVTAQLVPAGSVTQVTVGEPWQEILTVPMEAVGIRVMGAETSTHWALILLQPLPMGQDSSP